MFPTLTKLTQIRAAAFALTLGVASAAAQDLTADVVRNESSGTVTYTFHADGPAHGALYVFGATSLSPLPISTHLGPWYLDLSTQFGVGLIPLDASGKGQAHMTVPAPIVSGLSVMWQGVVIDPSLNHVFSSWAGCYVKETFGFAGGSGFAGSYSRRTGTYRFAGMGFPPGGRITIKINGNPVCMAPVAVDGKGSGQFRIPAPGLRAGDKVEVFVSDGIGPDVKYAEFNH